MGLFIIVVISILTSTFLYKRVNQNFSAIRYANEIQALWVAEGGVQDVRSDILHTSPLSGTVGEGNYTAQINFIGTNNTSDYYYVVSTGWFNSVSRAIEAVIQLITTRVDAGKFKYGVESTVEIDFKGSSQVYGETTVMEPFPAKTRDPDYYLENSSFSFTDLFGLSTNEIKALSMVAPNQYFNKTWPSGNISGVNWVEAPSSNFNGNVEGSGLLIIEGNLKVTGNIIFDGIIYVIGKLDMAGTALISGAILAESAATVDTTLTGTCDVEHNSTKIQSALDLIATQSTQVVSWKEL